MITWAGTAWARVTAYAVGQRVVNGANVYRASAAGTSAASPATGPSGTGTAITDGGVTWDYSGPVSALTVVAVAPELSTAAAASQVALLDLAVGHCDAAEFGDDYDAAVAYLAAHAATVARLEGAGPVTAEGVGPLSRSYASLISFGTLGLSSYGIMFKDLVSRTPGALGIVA